MWSQCSLQRLPLAAAVAAVAATTRSSSSSGTSADDLASHSSLAHRRSLIISSESSGMKEKQPFVCKLDFVAQAAPVANSPMWSPMAYPKPSKRWRVIDSDLCQTDWTNLAAPGGLASSVSLSVVAEKQGQRSLRGDRLTQAKAVLDGCLRRPPHSDLGPS